MEKKKLTDKQEMFCKEYMVDFNGTQAAIKAGYSEKTARQIGSDNLSKVDIQERLAELKQKRSDKVEITAERVIKEIATLAFSNIPDYFKQIGEGSVYTLTMKQFEDMPGDASRAISSIEQNVDKDGNVIYKVRLWDKSKNLEMLCKHLGITKEIFLHEFDPIKGKKEARAIIEELKKEQEKC